MTQPNTILLVEDDPKYVLLVRHAVNIANLHARLQVVKNVPEAIRYLNSQDPYANQIHYPLPMLMVTNMKLHDRPGLDFLEWVKEQPKLKSLPVVVLSSSVEVKEIDKAKDLSSAYFVKPLPLNDLVDTLKNIMSNWLILKSWQTWNWR